MVTFRSAAAAAVPSVLAAWVGASLWAAYDVSSRGGTGTAGMLPIYLIVTAPYALAAGAAGLLAFASARRFGVVRRGTAVAAGAAVGACVAGGRLASPAAAYLVGLGALSGALWWAALPADVRSTHLHLDAPPP